MGLGRLVPLSGLADSTQLGKIVYRQCVDALVPLIYNPLIWQYH